MLNVSQNCDNEIKITFETLDNVKNFDRAATKLEGDVIVSCGRYDVDGKSLMGILSLSLTSVLNLKIISNNKENEDEFIEKISNVIVTEDKGN